ncbi:MAG TPA: DNA repair protein RadA [Phycisphaerae bacterium]|nr:DNA repair protein RadA [Phycisphaerae bacterium]
MAKCVRRAYISIVAKQHSQFVCRQCGVAQRRWAGKCPACGEWNALEERVVRDAAEDKHRPLIPHDEEAPAVMRLADVRPDQMRRYSSGIGEFDRVLGGGIVPGSAILLGGDPGIGKSTLLLQVCHSLAHTGRKTLYITSEESLGQTRLRAERLMGEGIKAQRHPPRRINCGTEGEGDGSAIAQSDMLVSAQANLDVIIHTIQETRPEIVVVDSIQMVYRPDMTSSPGSAAQLRDAAARLIWLAKQMNFALILVGHVTKEGAIAGPKILEHLVDCVAYFEGDRFHSHRLVRAVKNRYGSTDELGIFEMTDGGLREVPDPSKMFLSEQRVSRPGSVVLAACEGTRTLLVEVQALCAQSVFGSAKRKATGVDAGRVSMLLAVIEKHAQCVLGDQDVFVNVVGGVRVHEPAADLAIALSTFSAMTNRCLPTGTVVCGELGLGSELRTVHHMRQRVSEAARVGFKRFLLPKGAAADAKRKGDAAIEVVACEGLNDAIRELE